MTINSRAIFVGWLVGWLVIFVVIFCLFSSWMSKEKILLRAFGAQH